MGPVEEAVRAELERMSEAATTSALGASAINLGRRQDEAHLPSQAAQCAKELRETLRVLGERFPVGEANDALDELRARRERGA